MTYADRLAKKRALGLCLRCPRPVTGMRCCRACRLKDTARVTARYHHQKTAQNSLPSDPETHGD